MFQNSKVTLKDAMKVCPFMQRQTHKFEVQTKRPASTNANPSPAHLRCPYTSGEVTKSSICPLTGIDVSRTVHSEVLQDINAKTPPSETNLCDRQIAAYYEESDILPESWKKRMSEMLRKKRENKTYREFTQLNKIANQAPVAEEVKKYKAFPDKIEYYCSNDYLNMGSHPTVTEAATKAALEHGCGSGGTRNISGNSELTAVLESEIADWHKKDDALLFNGCYVANDATLSTLLGRSFPGAQCFSDSGNHASMIQGILRGRNEQSDPSNRLFVFEHDNLVHLEELLSREYEKNPNLFRIVAFESVHSMGGNIQHVSQLCDLAHKYNAIAFCDEVHAIGLYGRTGAGIGELENVQHKIDIVSGTLGKGVGGFGGYIAANKMIVDCIRQHAPGFIFTTALPPTVIAPNISSIRILKGDEGQFLREEHWRAVKLLRDELTQHQIEYKKPNRASHVTTVELGSAKMADHVMGEMNRRGYYVQAIKHPTVPMGEEMLRLTVSPAHLKHERMIPRFVENLSESLLTPPEGVSLTRFNIH